MRQCGYGRRNEEFAADLWLIAKRTLDATEWRIFERHLLGGVHWTEMGMPKADFFHAVYRTEAKLGRAFLETEPYALFPFDQYFCRATRAPSRQANGVWQ